MTSCPECGREFDPNVTHWLGCSQIGATPKAIELPEISEEVEVVVDSCEHGDCTNPKRLAGKGPKPKFCEDHKDPKSRKE